MKKTLYDYKDIIKKLPIKDKYTKEELLIEDFLIEKENNIEIYMLHIMNILIKRQRYLL